MRPYVSWDNKIIKDNEIKIVEFIRYSDWYWIFLEWISISLQSPIAYKIHSTIKIIEFL